MTSTNVLLCLACSQTLSPNCLGGVGLVQSASGDRSSGQQPKKVVQHGRDNEAETFVLGDDEDEDENEEQAPKQGGSSPTNHEVLAQPPGSNPEDQVQSTNSLTPPNTSLPISSTYYIKSKDTVAGIALRYGVDPRQLCRLNKLPISTLTTTPHLLHTRTTLQLPPGSRAPSPPPADLQERLEARARERAGRAFQAVTKETDWGVAQTYVALLDIEDDGGMKEGKRRMVDPKSRDGRQALAVDAYLDDNAWEEDQKKAGLSPRIEPFPYFSFKGKENVEIPKEGSSAGSSDWWQKLWSGSSKP
ncbi:LysM domain protein [Ceratobasidium sp. AG-Ba]|nr:LysM domain protein [Ceratobasidium sp. AG-Ba]